MATKRRKRAAARDRLSELPDSLIFDIFWHMPMRDVVSTTFLSSRWRNLWKTAPCLNFEGCTADNDAQRVRRFINRVLIEWRGIKVQKLKIDLGSGLESSLYMDAGLWVRLAKEYGAEELHFDLGFSEDIIGNYGYDDNNSLKRIKWVLYWALQRLYLCSSLEKLYLKVYEMHIPSRDVTWNRLQYLKIDAYMAHSHSIEKVVSSSPKLEVLILLFDENLEDLTIQSTSLKRLSISKHLFVEDVDPCEYSELRISAPNLEKLEISGVPYSKCLIDEAPSLVDAKILFCGIDYYSNHLFFVGETLRQILPSIKHVRRLELSDWTVKALRELKKKKKMLSPFPNVEFLELKDCFEKYEEIEGVVEMFPGLKTFVFPSAKAKERRTGSPDVVVISLPLLEGGERLDSIIPFLKKTRLNNPFFHV